MPRRLRLLLLSVLTAVPVAAEAAVLQATHYVSARGLAPQFTAPPPYGVFHDMRWLFVYNASWLSFAGEAAALVVVRSLLNTAIIVLAWPPGRERPGLRRLLLSNLAFTAVCLAILSPWVCVSFAMSGTSLSWFVFGEVLEFVVLALVLQRGGIVPRWWLELPPPRAVPVTLGVFVMLTLAALAVNEAPGWWAVPAAAAAGAVNALLWYALIAAVLPRAAPARVRRRSGVVVAASRLVHVPALALVGALVLTSGGLVLMGHVFTGGPTRGSGMTPPLRSAAAGSRTVVEFVDGYNSSYAGTGAMVASPGLDYQVYSYRGLNSRGLPLPYTASATHESLARSARLLAQQVMVLHERTHRQVGIVAVSEGTLVARTYLSETRNPPVDRLVMFSPLTRPGRVYYPPHGASGGFGYVTGLELSGMLSLLRDSGGPPVSTAEPFVRSVIDNAPFYRNYMLCPTPGVPSIAFLSLASAAVTPPGPLADIPVIELPGVHASLVKSAQARQEAVRFLRGARLRQHRLAGFDLLRDAAGAWLTPALPLSVNPPWHYPAGAPDASFGGPICRGPG